MEVLRIGRTFKGIDWEEILASVFGEGWDRDLDVYRIEFEGGIGSTFG